MVGSRSLCSLAEDTIDGKIQGSSTVLDDVFSVAWSCGTNTFMEVSPHTVSVEC
jgi:hypothetical protein